MDWYMYIAVVLAGLATGFINTVAGSGSLVSLPMLIFLGLPADVANGTNRLGVLVQAAVSTVVFRKHGKIEWRAGLKLAGPAVVGGILGARIAVDLDEQLMRRIIGVVMLVMAAVIAARPKRWLVGRKVAERIPLGWWQTPIYFFIGVYGGFIQAGVGIFLIAGLVLASNYDLVSANAVKVLIVLCFTVVALGVFVANGQVDWGIGLLLAIGNAVGAWLAARLAIRRGAAFVRWCLIAVAAFSCASLLGVTDMVFRLFWNL